MSPRATLHCSTTVRTEKLVVNFSEDLSYFCQHTQEIKITKTKGTGKTFPKSFFKIHAFQN